MSASPGFGRTQGMDSSMAAPGASAMMGSAGELGVGGPGQQPLMPVNWDRSVEALNMGLQQPMQANFPPDYSLPPDVAGRSGGQMGVGAPMGGVGIGGVMPVPGALPGAMPGVPQGYVSHYPGPPIQTSKTCQGPEGCNLFIFHIPNDLTNIDLYNLFVAFGNVISARIMVENETGRSRGFGFVSYDNQHAADAAIKSMNGYQVRSQVCARVVTFVVGGASAGAGAGGIGGGGAAAAAVAAGTPPVPQP